MGSVLAPLVGTLDRNSAITAMVLADTTADERVREGHRLWPHIQGWAAELGLTATDAVAAQIHQPATRTASTNLAVDSSTLRLPIDQRDRCAGQITSVRKRSSSDPGRFGLMMW